MTTAPPPDLLRATATLAPDQLDALMGDLLRVRAGHHAPRVGADESPCLLASTPGRRPMCGPATGNSSSGGTHAPSPRPNTPN
jgi:hypothetical protein